MDHGFIKVAAATPHIRIGDCVCNSGEIIRIAKNAAEQGAKLLILPELCLTGYTAGDLFLQHTLLSGALSAAKQIVEQTANLELIIAFGMPLDHKGKLYDCAVLAYKGEVLGVVPKYNLPVSELRHFAEPDDEEGVISLFGKEVPFGPHLLFSCRQNPEFCLGIDIGDTLWGATPPALTLATAGATVIANLCACVETVAKQENRRQLVMAQSSRLVCAYLHADAGDGESTTDTVFSGHNLIAEKGEILSETVPFENGLIVTEIDVARVAQERRKTNTFPKKDFSFGRVVFDMPLTTTKLTRTIKREPFAPSDAQSLAKRCEMILNMQAHGLKTRLAYTKNTSIVLGVSGGLDSTLALLVSCRVMDSLSLSRNNIIAVTLPCFGTSKRTRSNAELLCEALGVSLRCVDISESVRKHFADIGQDENNHDAAYENAQARERTQVLMDIANQINGLMIGTGDLSELVLGWATYNGDHMAMYGVNGSIPKTLIRHILRHVADTSDNAALKDVLYDILNTPVSPELLPAESGDIAQKTENIVGPYELHDFFMYYVIRYGFSPTKVARLAEYAFAGTYTRKEILSWLKIFYQRFFTSQFKRSCMPDGPKVGSITFSPRGDWQMPSDAYAKLWLDEVEALIKNS